MKILKASARDKRESLSSAIRDMEMEGSGYQYMTDYDDDYIYFYKEEYTGDRYKQYLYRVGYTYENQITTLGNDIQEVVEINDTEYRPVEPEVVERSALSKEDSGLLRKLMKMLSGDNVTPVMKQFEDEQMVAIEPLYIAAGEVDLQGDTIEKADVVNMVDSLNEAIAAGNLQSGLFHKHKSDAFKIEKAWVNEVECKIGDVVVPEGMPLAKVQFNNEKAWTARKEGNLMGLSIGAVCKEIEVLDE